MAPAISAAPPTEAAIMIQSGIDSSSTSLSELPFFKTLDDGTGIGLLLEDATTGVD